MGKLQPYAGALSDGDTLRELITRAERQLTVASPEATRDVLTSIARAHVLAAQANSVGADTRPERVRIDALNRTVQRRAPALIKTLGGAVAYSKLRRDARGDASLIVWQLDKFVAQERQQKTRTLGLVLGALMVIAALAIIFRDQLLPPDPVGDAVSSAVRAWEQGEPERALAVIDSTLTLTPSNNTLLIWQGLMLEELDDPRALAAFAKAQSSTNANDFLIERAAAYVRLRNGDAVIADANALLSLRPESAEGYFLRASGHEINENTQRAIADLEEAARLAERAGNDTLFATARVRLAQMLQTRR